MKGFALGTKVSVGNGGYRLIEKIELEESVNGGSVIEVCHGLSIDEWELADNEWYYYKGVYVQGGQEVYIDDDWIRVSMMDLKKVQARPSFYSIKTTTGQFIGINDVTFKA